MPNAVLYVRDALGLSADRSPGVPPRLIGDVPDRSILIDGVDRAEAGAEWAAWWTAISEMQGRTQQMSGEQAAELRTEYSTIYEPETSPAPGEALRDAAQVLYPEGCAWVEAGPRRSTNEAALTGFHFQLIHDVVHHVAAEAGVSTGAINAAVSVLLVDGNWGAIAAPGFAWCSLAAANDQRVCSEIITAAIKSNLGKSH